MVAAPAWLPHQHDGVREGVGSRKGWLANQDTQGSQTDGMNEGDGSRKGWLANQDTQGSQTDGMSEGDGSRKGWLANQDTQGSRMSEGGGYRMGKTQGRWRRQ